MDANISLKKIAQEIEELSDPERVDLQMRYENARIAVDAGYRHAATLGQGGGANSEDYIAFARKVSSAIESDLNSKAEMLTKKKER